MRIAVLVKPVPDVAAGSERLTADGRLDRTASPSVLNGNDEFALEGALRLAAAVGGEVVAISMTPDAEEDVIRRALAMGADRAVHVSDPLIAGSDTLATSKILAAALAPLAADIVLAGIDTSDGAAGVVPAGVATILGLPYLSAAAAIDVVAESGTVRVRRATRSGFELLEAVMPAVVSCTQLLGDPRYPSLKSIMAARSKPVDRRSLVDLGIAPEDVGFAGATTRVIGWRAPEPRPPARIVHGRADEQAGELVAFLATRGLA